MGMVVLAGIEVNAELATTEEEREDSLSPSVNAPRTPHNEVCHPLSSPIQGPGDRQEQQKGPLQRMEDRLRYMKKQLRQLDEQIRRAKETSSQMKRR